jgi:hypothetical protein
MTAQGGEPGPFTAGPAANAPARDADLIRQAQRLGQQHRAAAITPFGDARSVSWDEGSTRLPGTLGATSPTTGGNAPRAAPDGSRPLRRTRSPRGRRYRARLMTAPGSPGAARGVLMLAEDGEPDSW